MNEAWLLPYSDMLTLLLSLFIVLFAVSNVNKSKFQQLQNEFGTILATHSTAPMPKNTVLDNQSGSNNNSLIKTITIQRQQEQQKFQQTFQSTQRAINNSPLQGKVQITLQSDGIHITLNSDVLFETESAKLTSQMEVVLKLLGPHLKPFEQNNIVIAGYTDNLPIQNNPTYPSNWELSSSRAISVMNYFSQNGVLNPKHVTIKALADNNPIADNSTAAGRAKNRRVEIIIQRVFN